MSQQECVQIPTIIQATTSQQAHPQTLPSGLEAVLLVLVEKLTIIIEQNVELIDLLSQGDEQQDDPIPTHYLDGSPQ